ncbi:MAG: hypothetical protein COA36_06110 [Desulfotalea sp.]|nr:MAG: hypothetical protein COA36_06110 [Desulfotalea sp.]
MKSYVSSILLTIVLFFSCACLPVNAADRLPIRVQMVLIKVQPLLEKNQYSQVIAVLEAFQKKTKGPKDAIHDHPEINFLLGNCYSLIGELHKAHTYYTQTLARKPNHLGAWQNLAKTEYELENYPAASKAFFKSYQLTDKTDATLLYYSAVTSLMAQQYQQCLHYFDLLLDRHPERISLQWKENLVYALIQTNAAPRAIPYMIELAEQFRGAKQKQWQEILLQQYMALEMRGKAMELVNVLTRSNPTVAVWWKALTHIQLQNEQYDKALAAMTIYSYLSPMTREEEKLLGDLYMQEGIPLKAVANYEHCVDKKVDQQTLVSLVRSYLSLDRPALALEKMNSMGGAIAAQKRSMLQAEIHYVMKDYKQAAKFYQLAAQSKGKNSARAYLMAAYSFWQQGNTTRAEENFHKAARTKRFKIEAEKAIKQLASLTVLGIS